MKCPFCGWNDCDVSDTRHIEESSIIKRRRECIRCKKRFTTYERIEIPPLTVIKSDGKRDPFNIEKLKRGIRMACVKRPIAEDVIEKIISEIEMELQDFIMEVPSKTIGEMVLKRLRKIDEVAYVRFASIYRKFDSVDTFLKELEKLKRKNRF
ncbi:MAG: transcriptional regulator NrdR [Elusimicrobia bacterium RIFOXYC2_FULL_34_12]|nr:MAG: transcriptional regulator NrdR [Elusimicrobia bacterium RIFOXYC2_FULL_34_12]OGS38984.1 MAG: transcriptional regulator NrdR [Elusimicrobia bacterium RIFOXYD2_FULL_34_30]HAM38705.1 transcriptional regulator NrdR [Elusimicrobiota bacterium]